MKRIVLAFDIERAGATPDYDTIAIGASVVDQDFNKLDEFFVKGLFSGEEKTLFEYRCWSEFWSKHPEQISQIKYTGDSPKKVRQAEMIVGFQEFRKKWELYAKKNDYKFELCSDCNVFDGGFINQLIHDHVPEYHPIPYNARPKETGDSEYAPFWETTSMQRGLLMSVDPEFTEDWGLTDRIYELYDITAVDRDIAHDHLPHHDAYTIACDLQILHGIQNGSIVKKQ